MVRAVPSLLSLSASGLASLIRRGETTSRVVVEAHIARIQAVNGGLNAVVAARFADARREADRADERLRHDDAASLPPFHGVPCTVKECFALAGMPQTAGLVARRGLIAGSDATAVARLRAAGFIPLGVTNLSELCMWMESNNRVYGRTNNAYDPRHIAGGSSGGEGAIVGAGRRAHRPGQRHRRLESACPRSSTACSGTSPRAGWCPAAASTPSPREPRSATCPPGRSRGAPRTSTRCCASWPAPMVSTVAAKRASWRRSCLRWRGSTGCACSTSRTTARWRWIASCGRRSSGRPDALARRGAQVIRERIPLLARSFDIWSAMLASAGGPSFSELLGGGRPVSLLPGFARFFLGRSPHTLPGLALAALEKLPALVPARVRRALEDGARLRREVVERIGPRGVLLYPPYPSPAPRHRAPLARPLSWVYTAIFNVLELPVTQVPLGLSSRGLPLGVQVAAVHGNDALTISVAMALEQEMGGWVPPPRLPALATRQASG